MKDGKYRLMESLKQMISATLAGGLGNMLFQIAASSSLAWDNKDTPVYNIQDYVTLPHRPPTEYLTTIFKKLTLVQNTKEYPEYHYDDIPFKKIKYSNPLRLYGYFQNEKYFKNNQEKIKLLFEPSSSMLNYINKYYQNILKGVTASIHVRRGDYLQLENEHPILKTEYYHRALKHLPKIDHILIFSNDNDWCSENLKFSENFTIIKEDDVTSLYLMSMCNHNIIANSTFSWWAAWLNKNKNKTIVGPEKWFGPGIQSSCKEIMPLHWIRERGF